MKGTLHFIGEAEAAIAARVHCFRRQGARLALGIALGVPSLYAIPTINERVALPDVSVAGNYGTAMFSAAVPTENAVTLKSRVTVLVLETGFLMGTTTAVHELGHARRVRAAGGNSQWETGDVNWWSYWAHRDPLASGATRWQVPYSTSLDQKISILAGGFNATTAWDESAAGSGPFGLVSARYSTLFYELAGVKSDTDDLDQISQAYRLKGYRIARREL